MSSDINYFLRHPEEAVEYFKKRQTSHVKLIIDLTSRNDKSEFEGMYREIIGLNEQFNEYYSDVIVAISDLEEMENKFKKAEIIEERYHLQKSKIKNKLVESFQELIEIDTKIEGVRKDIVTVADVEQEIKTALKEREGSGEKLKGIEKEPNNSQESRHEKKYGKKDEIFLSYKSEDRERAKIFAEALERQGFSVFWDRTILIGKIFDKVIEENLDAAKCVIVLWSRTSVSSDWVKNEAREGAKKEILVPVLIDNVKIPLEFRHLQTAQLIDWQGKLPNLEFDMLLRSVIEIVGSPGKKEEIKPIIPEEKLEKIKTNSGMKFTFIPEGEFMMGSEENDDEEPVHKVTISKPFYFGIYPVTQREWKRVMSDNPSSFEGSDLPVESISWEDVQEFIKKLNEKENTDKYRLPSEAEWEYAARAGTTSRYYFGDDEWELGEYAWYAGNSGSRPPNKGNYYGYDEKDWSENEWKGKTQSVGKKKPNAWGLYDMHGNVWEWVQDNWHDNYSGAPTDGSAWEGDSSARVRRGGSWHSRAKSCRSANRHRDDMGKRSNRLGFRLLREI